MALDYPRDMTTGKPWEVARLELSNTQEISRTANAVQVRQLTSPIWRGEHRTGPMAQEDAEGYHAELQALHGALRSFYAHTVQRPRPFAWTDGDLSGLTLYAIRSDNRAVRITGLPTGLDLTAGDYVAISTASGGKELVRLVTGGKVSSTGLSPWVEVVPHLRPSVAEGDPVAMRNPMMEVRLEPETLSIERNEGRLYSVGFRFLQVVR